MDHQPDSNSNSSSPADKQPAADHPRFELESTTQPPATPDAAQTTQTPALPHSADDSTFEVQESAPSTLPPRFKPSSVIIGPAIEDEPSGPKWPDLLAIACMALGAVGMFIHLLEIAGYGMAIFGVWEKLGSPEKDQQSWFYLLPSMLVAIAAFFFAGLLCYGGLALYKRWHWCTRWLNTWAIIKIPLVLIASIIGWAVLIMPAYHMFAGHEPETDWGHYATAFRLVWSFIWLAWELLLPVFILVWFRRKNVKALVQSWE